jgi:hypothetical protein
MTAVADTAIVMVPSPLATSRARDMPTLRRDVRLISRQGAAHTAAVGGCCGTLLLLAKQSSCCSTPRVKLSSFESLTAPTCRSVNIPLCTARVSRAVKTQMQAVARQREHSCCSSERVKELPITYLSCPAPAAPTHTPRPPYRAHALHWARVYLPAVMRAGRLQLGRRCRAALLWGQCLLATANAAHHGPHRHAHTSPAPAWCPRRAFQPFQYNGASACGPARGAGAGASRSIGAHVPT